MGKFADQLHITGDLEKALRQYKEALCKLQAEKETLQARVLPMIPDFTGAAIEGVPIAGPLLREGVKATSGRPPSPGRFEARVRQYLACIPLRRGNHVSIKELAFETFQKLCMFF